MGKPIEDDLNTHAQENIEKEVKEGEEKKEEKKPKLTEEEIARQEEFLKRKQQEEEEQKHLTVEEFLASQNKIKSFKKEGRKHEEMKK